MRERLLGLDPTGSSLASNDGRRCHTKPSRCYRMARVVCVCGVSLAPLYSTGNARVRIARILVVVSVPDLRRTRGSRFSPLVFGASELGRLGPRWAKACASKASRVCCAALLTGGFGFAALAFDKLATSPVLVAPEMLHPAYLQTVTDPLFGTRFTRITEPGRLLGPSIYCGSDYCRHRYSSIQAWNADQTLLAVNNGCNGICFLEGRTYKPEFHRNMNDDCKWHPTDPAHMICMFHRAIYIWEPRSGKKTIAYAPAEYASLQFGPYKGNPSRDGNRLVVRATNESGALVAFAYDLATRKKYRDINLDNLPGTNAYCGISPSGRYIYCLHKMDDGTEVTYIHTLDGEQVQHWTEHHRPGHGDMTIDEDGHDVYVGVSKADPDKWHVIKRRLRDGKVTDLAPAGYGTHVSTRNSNRPGWAFVSYEGSYSKVAERHGYAPFYQEVVAIRIDGSGEIRRIAQTRNAKSGYYSETHASPSPDASQVVWSSNWGEPGGPVADYVSKLSWPQSSSSE